MRAESRPRHLWLLMYHSVHPAAGSVPDPHRVTVSCRRLARQLRWLRRRGLRGVSAGELLRAHDAGRAAGLVGLTFDDGYADFLENAVPLLRRHGCTATVFALPGRLAGHNAWDPDGPRKPLLTADGIRAAAAAGMEIGSHGLRHVSLPAADEATLREEVTRSREMLRRITRGCGGQPVEGFCYPYGHVDQRAIDAVRAAGYGYACAVDPGPLTGRHALPRIHVGEADTAPRLLVKRLLQPLRRRPVPLAAGEGARQPVRPQGRGEGRHRVREGEPR